MKRLLLPASALVLVVTGCGAGTSAPQPVASRPPTRSVDVRPVAAARERAAKQAATRLLHAVVLPPGSRRRREPTEYGGMIRNPGGLLGKVVRLHGYWTVHAPLAFVVSFFERHHPPGLEEGGGQIGVGAPLRRELTFFARHPSRVVSVTGLQTRKGSTLVRVDAQVVWIYPRSPLEKVPPGVHRIEISGLYSASVTDRAQIERIAGWFDRLPIVPPGGRPSCPVFTGGTTNFEFRGAGGALLAAAHLSLDNPPLGRSGGCNPIRFTIGGRVQAPLLGGRFVGRVRRLLGIRVGA